MFRFKRLLLADQQSFIPRFITPVERTYTHGGSSAIPPTASLYRERFILLRVIILANPKGRSRPAGLGAKRPFRHGLARLIMSTQK
jgi:hypothetical protein